MHDTATCAERADGTFGPSCIGGASAAAVAAATGYPADEVRRGLRPAVDEFLAAQRGRWVLVRRYAFNNGLTVLARAGAAAEAADAVLPADEERPPGQLPVHAGGGGTLRWI